MRSPYEDGDILRFGKYVGRTIDAVIAGDPDYVQWAWDNIDDFDLSEELVILLEQSSRADR